MSHRHLSDDLRRYSPGDVRRYSASEVRRYARCPRQWWYESRQEELAALDPAEIARRLDALRRRYGRQAPELPSYRLLADLAERHERLESGRRAHRAHSRQVSRARQGCLPSLTLMVLVALIIATAVATLR